MRKPKLRQKKVGKHVYWYTQANGEAYFGKVGEVSYGDAKRRFAAHVGRTGRAGEAGGATLTVGGLFDVFLGWTKANRGDDTYLRRRSDCSRFARFVYGGRRLADVPAAEVTGAMLEAWRDNLRARPAGGAAADPNDRDKRGLCARSVLHSETSVRSAFNWATRHPSPT